MGEARERRPTERVGLLVVPCELAIRRVVHLHVPPRCVRWPSHPGLLSRRARRPHRGHRVRGGGILRHHAPHGAGRVLRRRALSVLRHSPGARPTRTLHAAVAPRLLRRLAVLLRHATGAPLLLLLLLCPVRVRGMSVRLLQVRRQALHGSLVVPAVLLLLLLLLLLSCLLLRLLLLLVLLLLLLLLLELLRLEPGRRRSGATLVVVQLLELLAALARRLSGPWSVVLLSMRHAPPGGRCVAPPLLLRVHRLLVLGVLRRRWWRVGRRRGRC